MIGPRRGDLVAGVTAALVLIPQSLAYAEIAGTPPVHHLYTAVASTPAGSLTGAAPDRLPRGPGLRHRAQWAEGMVWTSPERHGAMTGIMKAQIDWIPLADGAVRPTQGKTLAVMQVSGGSQSFNVVNQLRVLGRWMRMLTIPNQSSVAKAFLEFDEAGRMKPSAYYDRVVDVMEEPVKFPLLTTAVAPRGRVPPTLLPTPTTSHVGHCAPPHRSGIGTWPVGDRLVAAAS